MTVSPSRILCGLAAVVVVAAGAAHGEPIENLVPDTTFALFRVHSGSELVRKWQGTGYYAFMNHRDIQQAASAPLQGIEAMAMGMAMQYGISMDDILSLFSNQYGMVVAQPELGAGAGTEYVGMLEAGEAGKKVLAAVAEIIKKQRRRRSPFESFEGVRILKTPFLGLAAADVRGMLIVASPLNAAKNAVLRVNSPPQEPLSASQGFSRVRAKLDRDNDILWYVDLRMLLTSLKLGAKQKDAMSALGLDSVSRFGGTLLIDEGICIRQYFELTGKRKGIFKLLPRPGQGGFARRPVGVAFAGVFSPNDPGRKTPSARADEMDAILRGKTGIKSVVFKPKTQRRRKTPTRQRATTTRRRSTAAGTGEDATALGAVHLGETIPPDVAGFTSVSIDLAKTYGILLAVARQFTPLESMTWARRLKTFAGKAGFQDIGSFLRLFGKRVVWYTRFVRPYLDPGAKQRVTFLEIRSRPDVEKKLALLRKDYATIFSQAKPVTASGHKVHRMTIGKREGVYCVTGRYFIWANNLRAIQDYLSFASAGDTPLSQSESFTSAVQKLPPRETWAALHYDNPAPQFVYFVALVKANRIDLKGKSLPAPVPLDAGAFAKGLKGIRNPSSFSGLLPVSVTSVSTEKAGALIVSYHSPGGEGL